MSEFLGDQSIGSKMGQSLFIGTVQQEVLSKQAKQQLTKQRIIQVRKQEFEYSKKIVNDKQNQELERQRLEQMEQKQREYLNQLKEIEQIQRQKEIIEQQKGAAHRAALECQENDKQKRIENEIKQRELKQKIAQRTTQAAEWKKQEYYNNQGQKKDFINKRQEYIEEEVKKAHENASKYRENNADQIAKSTQETLNYDQFDKTLSKQTFMKTAASLNGSSIIDYSKTCFHNPLVVKNVEDPDQRENAAIKAEREFQLKKEQTISADLNTTINQAKSQERGRNALESIQDEKIMKEFSQQLQRMKKLEQKQRIIAGQSNSQNRTLPLTGVQKKVQTQEKIEQEFQKMFLGDDQKAQWVGEEITEKEVKSYQREASKKRKSLSKSPDRQIKIIDTFDIPQKFQKPQPIKQRDRNVQIHRKPSSEGKINKAEQEEEQQDRSKSPSQNAQRPASIEKQTTDGRPTRSPIRGQQTKTKNKGREEEKTEIMNNPISSQYNNYMAAGNYDNRNQIQIPVPTINEEEHQQSKDESNIDTPSDSLQGEYDRQKPRDKLYTFNNNETNSTNNKQDREAIYSSESSLENKFDYENLDERDIRKIIREQDDFLKNLEQKQRQINEKVKREENALLNTLDETTGKISQQNQQFNNFSLGPSSSSDEQQRGRQQEPYSNFQKQKESAILIADEGQTDYRRGKFGEEYYQEEDEEKQSFSKPKRQVVFNNIKNQRSESPLNEHNYRHQGISSDISDPESSKFTESLASSYARSRNKPSSDDYEEYTSDDLQGSQTYQQQILDNYKKEDRKTAESALDKANKLVEQFLTSNKSKNKPDTSESEQYSYGKNQNKWKIYEQSDSQESDSKEEDTSNHSSLLQPDSQIKSSVYSNSIVRPENFLGKSRENSNNFRSSYDSRVGNEESLMNSGKTFPNQSPSYQSKTQQNDNSASPYSELSYSVSDIDRSTEKVRRVEVFPERNEFNLKSEIESAKQKYNSRSNFNSGVDSTKLTDNWNTHNPPSVDVERNLTAKFGDESSQKAYQELGRFQRTDSSNNRKPNSQGGIKMDIDFGTESNSEGKEMSLAEIFRKQQEELAHQYEKKLQNNQQDPIGAETQQQTRPTKTQEQLYELRKQMMKRPNLLRDKSEGPVENVDPNQSSKFDDSKDNSMNSTYNQDQKGKDPNPHLMHRLAHGEQAKVEKQDYLALTNKNFELLPEVKQKREEDQKQEDLQKRLQNVQKLEKQVREENRRK